MYLPGETGFAQHESIWPVAASGQSARRQHSAAFWSAKAKLTQSPVLTRRTANPRTMMTGLNRFISYIRWTRASAMSSPVDPGSGLEFGVHLESGVISPPCITARRGMTALKHSDIFSLVRTRPLPNTQVFFWRAPPTILSRTMS